MKALYIANIPDHTTNPHKKAVYNILEKLYDEVICLSTIIDPLQLHNIADYIKNTNDPIFLWGHVHPFAVWVTDLCKRFSKTFIVVERGLIPTQTETDFAFFAGGICCDAINIQPKYFDPSTYDKNVSLIKEHYKQYRLERKQPKDKIVVVGQLMFDSTITHFANFKDYSSLIDQIVDKEKIDIKTTDVIFCPHPRESIRDFKYRLSDKRTIEECQDAKMVYSVSSTTSYEIAGLDIPIKILANGNMPFPLNRGWDNVMQCLSTMRDFEFDSNTPKNEILEKIDRVKDIVSTEFCYE